MIMYIKIPSEVLSCCSVVELVLDNAAEIHMLVINIFLFCLDFITRGKTRSPVLHFSPLGVFTYVTYENQLPEMSLHFLYML